MSYILKQFDTDLMKFELVNEFDGLSAKILWINDAAKNLLPLDLKSDEKSLLKWIKGRTIPSNRAYVQNFLAKLGLNEKNTKGIIDICRGLSLNDCYWIVMENFNGTFAEYNLYDNKFNTTLSQLAFTGYGSYANSLFQSSPEFTTNGMLAKCWRRIDGKILLFKSGTEGAANTGNEPYSEFYAYQIAKTMGIDAVKYGLAVWKGKLCSTCELFTNKDLSYIPIGRLVAEGGLKAVLDYYKNLGEEFYQSVIDMLVFDAVICNTDRHFGNFGLLIDNKTNTIKSNAPVFDNGLSLFNFAMDDDIKNLGKYAKTRMPATYPDFISYTKNIMGIRQRDMLCKLLNFKFTKNSHYNLNDYRLKAIEEFIMHRVKELLAE